MENKLYDKDGNLITEERIKEVMKEAFKDGPSIKKEGDWYKIDTGNPEGNERRIIIYTLEPGYQEFWKAFEKELKKNTNEK